MDKLYDLSHPFSSGMPVYPGDEPVLLERRRSATQTVTPPTAFRLGCTQALI